MSSSLTHSPSASPARIVKCSTTADLLAALPRLVGFTATNSIFVLMFSGNRTKCTFRVDLPSSDDDYAAARLADEICEILHQVSSTWHTARPDNPNRSSEAAELSAPAIVITCDQSFAESDGLPFRKLAKRVQRRLRREGLEPRELCCKASDGWGSYLDPDCPVSGRPLTEIAESPIALDLALHDEVVPDLSSLGAIPEPDPKRVTAVARALSQMQHPSFPGSGGTPPPLSEPAEGHHTAGRATGPIANHAAVAPGQDPESILATFVETETITRSLLQSDRALSPRMTARLIRAAAHPDHWLRIALGVMTRPEFPAELASDLGPHSFVNVPVDSTPGSDNDSDDSVLHDRDSDFDIDCDHSNCSMPSWSVGLILTNICSAFADQPRLNVIHIKTQIAVSEAPHNLRPPLLAFAAWSWWLAGNQTVAGRQVEEALAIDPNNDIALMVKRLVRSPFMAGYMPFPELAAA